MEYENVSKNSKPGGILIDLFPEKAPLDREVTRV